MIPLCQSGSNFKIPEGMAYFRVEVATHHAGDHHPAAHPEPLGPETIGPGDIPDVYTPKS